MSLARLGGVYALLHASHTVGDYWVQTDHQAQHKGDDGPAGERACLTHVMTLTAVQGAAIAAGCLATGERLQPGRVLAGLAINAASHYAADRREHGILPKLVDRLDRHGFDKGKFYATGEGKALLDQAWHVGWLAISAAVIAGGR